MCLIAFAINSCTSRPFVLASNRDEFLDRPTLPLARWKEASGQEIISGRDARAGGTWLGVTPHGRVAFLTNVRKATGVSVSSTRGALVTRWLESRNTAEDFFKLLKMSDEVYCGFNLVLGDLEHNAWSWVTNRSTASVSGWQAQALPAGVYGLSNAALDTDWPKTIQLKRALSAALSQKNTGDVIHELLFSALASQVHMPPPEKWHTGEVRELELAAASAFVDIPGHAYGTRTSAVLAINKRSDRPPVNPYRIDFQERTYTREITGQPTVRFLTSSVVT